MGVNIDDKLKMFQDLLTDEINAQNEKEVARLSREYESELESSQNKIHLQADKILEEAEVTSALEIKNQIQKNTAERNKQILFNVKQYTDELFRLLRERVSEMPMEKTVSFITSGILNMEQMFANEETILLKAEAKDYELVEDILKEMKRKALIHKDFRLTKASIGGLGGIVGENLSATLRADFSIASFLEENKEKIGRNIQTRLSEVMKIDTVK